MAIYVIVKRTDFRLCMICTIILIPVAIIFLVINFNKSTDSSQSSSTNTTNSTGPRATPSLQFLTIFSRHGNRPPLGSFPTWNHPADDKAVWPFGPNPLTKLGRVKTYRLGAKLRTLYDGFLDQLYYPKDVLMYSTLTARTLQSAEGILAGLFPPEGFQVWSTDLRWQPIPVYPTYIEGTHLWADERTVCPKYYDAKALSLVQFNQDYATNISALMTYLQPYTGVQADSWSDDDLYTVWDCLISAENQGLPLPDWAASVYPEPMDTLITKLFAAQAFGSDTMIRLAQGLLFQEVMGFMVAKVNGTATPDRKLVYYSGHDTTLLGIQAILQLPHAYDTIVRTGSALIMELHRSAETSNFYVQVLYIDGNSTDLEPVLLDVPGCDPPCDFYTLSNLTAKYYNITNYNQECQGS